MIKISQMQDWYTTLTTLDVWQNWNHSILFITLASLIVWGVWRIIHSRLTSFTEQTKIGWDELLLHALKTPISTIIWCWPATISLGIVQTF